MFQSITNLANAVQPLIRYELGDHVTVHAEPCTCGSPLPVITVRGRQDDPLHMAGRDGGTVTLLPLALTDAERAKTVKAITAMSTEIPIRINPHHL